MLKRKRNINFLLLMQSIINNCFLSLPSSSERTTFADKIMYLPAFIPGNRSTIVTRQVKSVHNNIASRYRQDNYDAFLEK